MTSKERAILLAMSRGKEMWPLRLIKEVKDQVSSIELPALLSDLVDDGFLSERGGRYMITRHGLAQITGTLSTL